MTNSDSRFQAIDSTDSVMDCNNRLSYNSHMVNDFPSLRPDCYEEDILEEGGNNLHYGSPVMYDDGSISAHYAEYSHFADNTFESMDCEYTAHPQQRELLRRWNQHNSPRSTSYYHSTPTSPHGSARATTGRHWGHNNANIALCRSHSEKCPPGPAIQAQVHMHRRYQEQYVVNQQPSSLLSNSVEFQQYIPSSESQRMQASLTCSSEGSSSRSSSTATSIGPSYYPTPKTSPGSRMASQVFLSSTSLPSSIITPDLGMYHQHSADSSGTAGSLSYSQQTHIYHHNLPASIPNYAPPVVPVASGPCGIMIQSSMRIADESEQSDRSAEEYHAFLESISQCNHSVASAAIPNMPLTASALSQINRNRNVSTDHSQLQSLQQQVSQKFLDQETDADAQPLVEHEYCAESAYNEDSQNDSDDLERAIQQSLEDESQRRRQAIRDRLALNRAFIESMRDLQSQEVVSVPPFCLSCGM